MTAHGAHGTGDGMIFGREPAMVYTLAANLITLVSGLGLGFTIEQQGAVNAAVFLIGGCVVAWRVAAEKGIALLGGVAKSLIAVALAFGVHLPPEAQSSLLLLVTTAIGFVVRSQVTASVPPAVEPLQRS